MTWFNYLGSYASVAALWESFPEGGIEGDYVKVGNDFYGWNQYTRQWQAISEPDDAPDDEDDEEEEEQDEEPTQGDEGEDEEEEEDEEEAQDVNFLGAFASVAAAWAAIPEGGQDGDYITIGGTRYNWNAIRRNWVVSGGIVAPLSSPSAVVSQSATDINYLGAFASIGDVWVFYPEGGRQGDYVYIVTNETIYSWDTTGRTWVVSTDPSITVTFLLNTPTTSVRINYLGDYESVEDAWIMLPEGGYEGDYIHVDEDILLWNKYSRNWGDTSDPATPAIVSQTVYGDLQVMHNLIVSGAISADTITLVNSPFYTKVEMDRILSSYALKAQQIDTIYIGTTPYRPQGNDVFLPAYPTITEMGGVIPSDIANLVTLSQVNEFVSARFLSKLNADLAEGHITFQQGLTALARCFFNAGLTAEGDAIIKQGAQFGTFISGMYAGTGAAIDAQGNAEVESLKVRSYMEVMELIVNRLSAIEGDQLLTEADTIVRVVDLHDGTYRLYLQEKWEGYFTAQAANNVLKGILNTLTSGHGETTLGSGEYYTCWMRVLSVNTANNTIEVIPYPDEQVPGGRNYLPQEMMKIARWGNVSDTTRQSCLYFSSTEGRIVKLKDVTAPIIDASNYGFVLGKMPEFITNLNLPIANEDDYIYVRGVLYQDMLEIDYQGHAVATYVDRGLWEEDPEEPYHYMAINSLTGVFEISDVWYMGCKWRCLQDEPDEAPRWNSTQWAQIEGNPAFEIEIESSRGDLFDYEDFHTVLSIVAHIYNMDVTSEIQDADVAWTRYSEDYLGNERAASDLVWASRRTGSGKTLSLTQDDIDYDGEHLPRLLRFIATAVLRDGANPNGAASSQAAFEYSS